MAISLLKGACIDKSYCSFKDLQPGDYLISNFFLTETRYGRRLKLDLGDKVVILPERFSVGLKTEDVDELNRTPQLFIYRGKDVNNRNRIICDFKTLSEFASMSIIDEPA